MNIHNGTNEGHRDTVEAASEPQGQVKLGSLLAEIEQDMMLTYEAFEVFENVQELSLAQGVT